MAPGKAALRKPYTSKKDPIFGRQASVVIVGGGPSGLHFASKMIKAGFKPPVVLEATDRPGGKSHTKTYDEYPQVPHEMGTCYMSRGYGSVRELLKEYGLDGQEVEFGGTYIKGSDPGGPERVQRMVWDLGHKSDLRRDRAGGLGQDFDDWVLDAASGPESGDKVGDIETAFQAELKAAKEEEKDLQAAVDLCTECAEKDGFDASKPKGFLSSLEGLFRSEKKRAFVDKDQDGHEDVTGLKWALGSLRIARAASKYLKLHKELFGAYAYGLPPRPTKPEALADLDCTFGEWLERHELGALHPIFTYSQSAQGYGAVPWVPALYGLWWNSPEYLDLTFTISGRLRAKSPVLSVLACGFAALWRNMVDRDGIDVRVHCRVTKVDRAAAGVTVTYEQTDDAGGAPETKEIKADYVVMALPFKPAVERGMIEPTDEERAIIERLDGVTLKTTLVSIPPPPRELSVPGQVWLGPLDDYNARLRGLRHSGLAIHGRELEARPRVVAYQALRTPPTATTNDELREGLVKDLAIAGFGESRIMYEKTWDYFWHFPQAAINDGAPWALLEMQGANRTIWAGASACFESVLDVTAYNDLLFEMFKMDGAANP